MKNLDATLTATKIIYRQTIEEIVKELSKSAQDFKRQELCAMTNALTRTLLNENVTLIEIKGFLIKWGFFHAEKEMPLTKAISWLNGWTFTMMSGHDENAETKALVTNVKKTFKLSTKEELLELAKNNPIFDGASPEELESAAISAIDLVSQQDQQIKLLIHTIDAAHQEMRIDPLEHIGNFLLVGFALRHLLKMGLIQTLFPR